MLPLMQVTDAWRLDHAVQGTPHSLVPRDLNAVRADGEIGVGTEVSRDLGGARLIDAELSGFQGRIGGFKLVLDLLPGKSRLRARDTGDAGHGQKQKWAAPPHAVRGLHGDIDLVVLASHGSVSGRKRNGPMAQVSLKRLQ